MDVTIKDITLIDTFKKNSQLIGGSKGINKIVKFISVMEVVDFEKFIYENNHFVLTTFSFCCDNNHLIEDIFRALIKKNISGLVIKINRYLKIIPDALIELANKHDVPIIILDEKILFSKVILDVSSLIINSQYNTLKSLNSEYELLNSAILTGKKLDFFIKRISENLSCNCYCFTFDNKIIGKHCLSQDNKEINFKSMLSMLHEDVLKQSAPIKNDFFKQIDNFYIIPCITNNNILGYIFLEDKYLFTEKELLFLKQIVNYISIKLMSDSLIESEKENSRLYTLNKIFYDNSLSSDIINKNIKILGIEPKSSYILILLNTERDTNTVDKYFKTKKIYKFFKKYTEFNILTEFLFEGIVILLFFDEEDFLANLSDTINSILQELYSYLKYSEQNIKIGYSQKYNELKYLSNSLKEAQESIIIGSSLNNDESIYGFNQYVQFKMLAKLLDTKEYFVFYNKIISPLLTYDKNNKLDLLNTLKVCVESNTLNDASNKLFIHINSLRYRMEKIKSLTGEDFFTSSGRQTLSNAITLYNIEKIYSKD